MIDAEHLKVGNEVFTVPHGLAVITKVGRKYTYTTNGHLIIENSRLMTKHTGMGVSTHYVFESEKEYIESYKQSVFIQKVMWELENIELNLEEARIINHTLGLGVEE